MMKWKVVKNPRSSSADRSLECLRNDVQQQQPNNISNGNNNNNNDSNNNDSNNNVGEESKQDNSSPTLKETNRQRESSLVRKPSVVATECINLKSILGLTRQRSETNLSDIGLVSTEPRRSRSEVRGVSCDRLTVGYHHTAPGQKPPPENNGQKTRSSSPPCGGRPGWLRGRKRERESRNPVKNNNSQDVFGKTVVTGSNRIRTGSSKTRNGGDCRTIVDGSDCKQKNNKGSCSSSSKCSSLLEPRKGGKKSGDEGGIIEEEIYCDVIVNSSSDRGGKLLEENVVFKDPNNKVARKKGLAPKQPLVAVAKSSIFKDAGGVNLNNTITNGHKVCESSVSLIEVSTQQQPPPNRKPPRKNHQTYNGRNLDRHQDRRSESRAAAVKLNNLKNCEKAFVKSKNNINAQSVVVAVAEIHHKEAEGICSLRMDNNRNKNITVPDIESLKNFDSKEKIPTQNKESLSRDLKDIDVQAENEEESLPFHIDTPDYSTLDSVNCNNSLSADEDMMTLSKDDILNCNTDCDESSPSLQESSPLITSDNAKVAREISLSSILRDSASSENKDSEPKKTVRFEKLDLIEKYKKHKTENSSMDTEDDTDVESGSTKNELDVNSNEIPTSNKDSQSSLLEDFSQQCSEKSASELTTANETNCSSSTTVNVVVRNPSPAPQDFVQNAESPTQFVVKKSFVLTIAKQEKGFKSLFANKKPEIIPEPPKADQQQISVTFLCSGPPSEGWVLPTPAEHQRLRSISVPPRSLQPVEVVNAFPAIRGRSRERRSKERQHCKKNHKARKKDAVFVMPQAVIDELSQVLEKRKPSLDEIPVHP